MVNFNWSYLSIRKHDNDTPIFSSTKSPECEESEMGSEDEITLHINLIWMSRWVCELGCINNGYRTLESERCQGELAGFERVLCTQY